MIHGLIALGTCAVLLALNFAWPVFAWPAMFWPASYYFGREMAQAEYRYIEAHGGKRANCPWYCGLLPESWTAKSVVDCVLPLVVGVVAVVVQMLWLK